MSETSVTCRSALEDLVKPGVFGAQCERCPSVSIAERPSLTIVQISARASDKRKGSPALKKVVGIAPPPKTGETRIAPDSTTVHCIGPDRWVVVSETAKPADLVSALREALSKTTAAVVDLSSGRTVVSLWGPKAPSVMMAITPVDLHPSVADAPCNLHSFITEATGLVAVLSENGERVFELHLPRSYAAHVWEMLTETAAQYGYRTEG